jgi:nucleoside-diphosphate-sugar epimerase
LVESIELPRVLVLGASGYIGKALLDAEQNKVQLIPLRHIDKFDYKSFSSKITTIINLSSSSFASDENESWEANYNYQRDIISSFASDNVKWVQVASYYELQIPNGRTDFYSTTKLEFRNFITSFVKQHSSLSLTSVMLPHVFGGNEVASRLIPTIRRFISGEKVSFGSPDQLIPLIHIKDVVEALLVATNADQSFCLAKPMWQGTLGSLLEVVLQDQDIHELPNFLDNHENYKNIAMDFPENLRGFEPKYQMSNFIKDLRLGLSN